MKIYAKSILVGAAASMITVIVFMVIAISIGMFFPQVVALPIFPATYHRLGWGGYFEFPIWHALIVGVLAFAIAFAWMLTRSRTSQQ